MGKSYFDASAVGRAVPFDNTTNGFVAIDIQAAIEEVNAKIVTAIANTQNVYVSKNGSDTTGNGSFGQPYLTIGTALTAIVDSSPTKRYAIQVGPGDYAENLVLKANVFIVGQGPLVTKITGSTININEATWNNGNDNRSGFQDLSLNNVATWDFTAQTSGTAGKLYFYNIRTAAAWTTTANNAINQMIIQDSQLFGTTTFTGMTVYVCGTTWQSGNIVINSSTLAGVPANFTAVGCYTQSNITATWTSNSAVTLILASMGVAAGTVLTASGASCTVNADASSLPVPANRSFVSSAVLNRLSDNFAGGLRSSANNIDTTAATAPVQGQSLVATSPTTATWQIANDVTVDYGDGSDGDVTQASGTVTLSRTMYYNSLTLSGTAILDTNGFKIYCKGTLSISGTASIVRTPNNGSNGSAQTLGAGAAAMAQNDMGSGLAGQGGSNGGSNNGGVAGNNAGTATGYGAAGGASGQAGSTGTAGAAGTYTHVPERIIRHDHVYLLAYKNGGQGGAGGAGGAASLLNNGGGGGGGGSGGGVVMIFAQVFNNTSSVGIVCKGGNGGNGGNATGGNSNGGGGGGGGGGGQIYIVCFTLTAAGTLTVTGGTGGTGGVKAGTGSNGSNGSTGSTGHTTIYSAQTNAWTVT